jgi:hypothetical protein
MLATLNGLAETEWIGSDIVRDKTIVYFTHLPAP